MTFERDTEQMSETPGPGRFAALDESECLELLRSQLVGRVAFTEQRGADGGAVTVLPVAYMVADESLIGIVTGTGGILATLRTPGRSVGFEIDDVDVETATGWSVLASCRTETIEHEVVASLRPWAGGERDLPIGLRIERISGRIVSRAE